MKTNLLKRLSAILAVLLLCICFAGCGEEPAINDQTPTSSTQSDSDTAADVQEPSADSNTQSSTPQATSSESEPTYYYAAIEGAVIVEQNGTQYFVYCKKCEKCGEVQENIKNTHYGGNLTTSYFCPDCKQTQRVEIEETVNW